MVSWTNASSLAAEFSGFEIVYTRRGGNAAADCLVNQAMGRWVATGSLLETAPTAGASASLSAKCSLCNLLADREQIRQNNEALPGLWWGSSLCWWLAAR
jgi:hypothetical protein